MNISDTYKINIVKGDITKENLDTIVNSEISSLLRDSPVNVAIHLAGGKQILDIAITSIEIIHENWGIMRADEISKSNLKINKNGDIKVHFYSERNANKSEIYKYKVSDNKIKEFFRKLITDVKVLQWDDDYSIFVCDGYHWDVIIKFSDKSIKKISGTVEPPENSKVLEEMIYKLVKYEEEPWLF